MSGSGSIGFWDVITRSQTGGLSPRPSYGRTKYLPHSPFFHLATSSPLSMSHSVKRVGQREAAVGLASGL